MAKKIFLLEDDQVLLNMYTRKLQKEGFEVETAQDGEEGLKKVSETEPKPDIILADVMLPKLNGFEFLERIKKEEKTKSIPVILLTNLGGGEQDREKGKALGAIDYLVKSEITPNQIIEKIRQSIG